MCDAQTGEPVANLPLTPVAISDNKSIAEVLQISASLPPDGSYEERNKKIEEAVRNPSVFVHANGTQVSSSDRSSYSIEVRVKPQDAYQTKAVARPARVEKGQAYVDIRQGEVYEVHVFNRSGKEVAVSLSIDGIDEFHFSKDRGKDGRPQFSHWIMMKDATGKAREELNIPGWFNTAKDASQTYLSFLVVGYGQGGVSKAGIAARGKVGVIRVGISECYPLRAGDSPKSGDETGFGPPIGGQVAAVHYGIGVEIDSVAIRYTREQK